MASSPSVVFCQKNLDRYSQSVYDALVQNHPEVGIEIKDCVDMCELCTDVPFAMRNNAVVGGRDADDLYRKLERGLSYAQGPALIGTARYKPL